MSRSLTYSDGVAVEPFDHVELLLDGGVFEGQVTAVYPRRGEVRVAYGDRRDPRRDGEPRRRAAVALVQQVELIRRDG
ncbi:MAG: hypothetical protein CVT80_00410 [Alphaproteobacteria bacterium HGW-Alphaproteobacteria-2]|nr:MAG: hypothetical protein CVT80_00410 [Alphaproteobacteria bacterium HGW-Alphaproteobacteria-2]